MVGFTVVEADLTDVGTLQALQPYVQINRRGNRMETTVQQGKRPVWREPFFLVMDAGQTVGFEVNTKRSALPPATLGVAHVLFDAAFVGRVENEGEFDLWLDLRKSGKDKVIGRLLLHCKLNKTAPARALAVISQIQDVSRPGTPEVVRYVEPFFRQLRVKLRDGAVNGGCSEVYMTIRCGLFEAATEHQQLLQSTVVWNEDFIIGVPGRAGSAVLPPELKFKEVELVLMDHHPEQPDQVIGKATIPFSQISGYSYPATPVASDQPPWQEHTLTMPTHTKLAKTVMGQGPKDGLSSSITGRETISSSVTAALYFDSGYDKPLPDAMGNATLRFEELKATRLSRLHGTFSVYITLRWGMNWIQFDVPGQSHPLPVQLDKVFKLAVQVRHAAT